MSHSHTVVSIVGARPQFVKTAVLSPTLRDANLREVPVHTGQHHHGAMTTAVFESIRLPAPDVNLQNRISHARRPDWTDAAIGQDARSRDTVRCGPETHGPRLVGPTILSSAASPDRCPGRFGAVVNVFANGAACR